MALVMAFATSLAVIGVAALIISARSKHAVFSRVVESLGTAIVGAALLSGGAMLITQTLSDQTALESLRQGNATLIRESVIARAPSLNFGGLDLTDRRLSALDLDGASLFGSVLDGADISWGTISCEEGIELPEALTQGRLAGCADLGGVSAIGANLRGVALDGASLFGADLTSADLGSATATRAIFSLADLRGANLTHIDARWADFSHANLSGADLRGAKLSGALLAGVCHDDRTVWPEGFSPPESDCTTGVWGPASFEA